MAIDFPDSPYIGQPFSSGTITWVWDGSYWRLTRSTLSAPTGPTGFSYSTSVTGPTGNQTPYVVLPEGENDGRGTASVFIPAGNYFVKNSESSVTSVVGDVAVSGASGFVTTTSDAYSMDIYNNVSWTPVTSNFGTSSISLVAHNGLTGASSLWVAGGVAGTLRTSTDTVTWVTQVSNFGTSFIQGLAYANNLWVAVGGTIGTLRTSTDAITWVTQESNFGTSTIFSIAHGNGLWVAGGGVSGGGGGVIRTSTDASSWTTQYSNFFSAPGTAPLSAAYAFGFWNVVGDNGSIVSYFSDFSSFERRTTPLEGTTNSYNGIAYGNNILVAVGDVGTVNTSTDAITWVTQTSNFGTSTIQSVAYNNGLWVAGGTVGQLRTSTDAITWVTQTSNFGTTNILSVAYGNGLWVAVGSAGTLRTSTDTVTWVTRTSNFGATAINSVIGPTKRNLITNPNFETDATGWSNAQSGGVTRSTLYSRTGVASGLATMSSITDTNAFFFSAANFSYPETGIYTVSAYFYIPVGSTLVGRTMTFTSEGGTASVTGLSSTPATLVEGTWVRSSQTVNCTVVGTKNLVARLSGTLSTAVGQTIYIDDAMQEKSATLGDYFENSSLWVAGGAGGTLRTSTDAITWVTRTTPVSTTFRAIGYGNGGWLAGGFTAPGIIRSTDAITWVTSPGIFTVGTDTVTTLTYDNNSWYVGSGSGGTIRTSTDAVSWVTRSSFTYKSFQTILSIGYSNNLFVAAGNSGALTTSPDGITWTRRTSNFGNSNINSVAYGNGIWVAVGATGQLRTSIDAVTWVTQTSNFGTSAINSVAYGEGAYVIAGVGGAIKTSNDFITWVTQESNFGTTQINSVAYGDGLFVVGGLAGTINTSKTGYSQYNRTTFSSWTRY